MSNRQKAIAWLMANGIMPTQDRVETLTALLFAVSVGL